MAGYLHRICEHAGIIRLGPRAFAVPDPFEWSAVAEFGGDLPVVWAVVQTPTRDHLRGIYDVLSGPYRYYRSEGGALVERVYSVVDGKARIKRGHAVSGSRVAPESEPQRS